MAENGAIFRPGMKLSGIGYSCLKLSEVVGQTPQTLPATIACRRHPKTLRCR